MKNSPDALRDPVWQFIGVVVGIVAIFMTFLTLPNSVQGTALVGIVIALTILIFTFIRNLAILSLLFLFAYYACSACIASLTYYQVPFFTENFGLVANGVIYAKSNIGSSILDIEYIMFFICTILFPYYNILKRQYFITISYLLIFIPVPFVSIPRLYTANFVGIKVLNIIDFVQPKSILGVFILISFFVGFSFLCIDLFQKKNS